MQGASVSSTNARSVVKSSVLRGVINRIDVNKDKVTNGKTAKEIMDLKAIEEEIERGAKTKDGMNREETAVVCYLWIVLALAYKKESDYKHCYQVLTNVRRAERALNATPLDQAVTEVNLGTCLFFQREFGEALKHSSSAKDLLVQEIKIAGQEHTQAPPAYKRKLLMNLVLAYFNRAVQYYALGDMEAYKVNINQSLELATQKFGKEESVTRTITGLLESKDKRELKPFFVNKTTDVNGLIKIDNRELISYRDIFVDPNSQLDRAAKERAKIMKERLEKKERIEEKEKEREMAAKSSKYTRANSTNKQILSPVESTIEPKRSNSVSPIEVNAIKGGGTRGDSTTASGGPTTKTLMQDDDEIPMNRSKPMSKKLPMSDLGANSNLAFTSAESAKKTSSSASSYPLNRLSVALKYMK